MTDIKSDLSGSFSNAIESLKALEDRDAETVESAKYPLTFKLTYGADGTNTAQYIVETAMDELFIQSTDYTEDEGEMKRHWRATYCKDDRGSCAVVKAKSFKKLKAKIQKAHDERMDMLLGK